MKVYGENSKMICSKNTIPRFCFNYSCFGTRVGCALTFASEAKFENKAKILFRLEAKKKPDFT
jgi:hypothetical protein